MQGDDSVLSKAKEARSLWGRYRSTFLGKDGADNFVRKIVEDELAPDQVANWLFGSATTFGGGRTSLMAKKLNQILGPDSVEMQSVKRAIWDDVAGLDGKSGPQKIASNLDKLLDGKGKTLARELFTESEIAVMRRYRNVMRTLVRPDKSKNPSGSGYEVARAVRSAGQMVVGALGFHTAGPGGAVAARAGADITSRFLGSLRAKAAINGVRLPPPVLPNVGIGVTAGGEIMEPAR
jgi:hypothetical protein